MKLLFLLFLTIITAHALIFDEYSEVPRVQIAQKQFLRAAYELFKLEKELNQEKWEAFKKNIIRGKRQRFRSLRGVVPFEGDCSSKKYFPDAVAAACYGAKINVKDFNTVAAYGICNLQDIRDALCPQIDNYDFS